MTTQTTADWIKAFKRTITLKRAKTKKTLYNKKTL